MSFRCLQAKQLKFNDKTDKSENSNDSSLFHLFDIQPKKENEQSDSKSYNTFLNILSHSSKDNDTTNQVIYFSNILLNLEYSFLYYIIFFLFVSPQKKLNKILIMKTKYDFSAIFHFFLLIN